MTANYKETQIIHIYIGQEVRIKVDALPGKVFHGTVTAISEATGSKYSLVPTDNSAGDFVQDFIHQPVYLLVPFAALQPCQGVWAEWRKWLVGYERGA